MVSVPRSLNLQPHILMAHSDSSCEHACGQTISRKPSGYWSSAKSGNRNCFYGWSLVLILMQNGQRQGTLRVLWALRTCSKSEQRSRSKEPAARSLVPGRRQQHMLKEECQNGAKHPLILPFYSSSGSPKAVEKSHVCLILHFGIFPSSPCKCQLSEF